MVAGKGRRLKGRASEIEGICHQHHVCMLMVATEKREKKDSGEEWEGEQVILL